ncbi:KPN_02809 family neutral zinc metallopeptidase [Rhizobium alvei]|uniref:Neutral zinc metallopeptidase n=1 Tax=Rhizobium alvei TaxID=1132659 RepID=A0ABT8YKJ3_9HYPH|nr:neutral zinc metallopeptidase [Rhizobium alvei]MDO6964175.1 neutral zinc metallopeptidase [Rhizobium alvei]
MDWKGRRQSDNIEDRRGSSPGPMGDSPFGRRGLNIPIGGGKGGIGSIILVIVIFVVLQMMGVDVTSLMNGGSPSGYDQGEQTTSNARPGANDEMKAFVATMLAETEETWSGIFSAAGKSYREPKLVMFSGSTSSPCGTASAATGPFYCPTDEKVYLDTDFFNEMATRFGASGDFAEAYVIAHEVGHHVQNLIGVLPKFNRARQSMSESEANAMSVRVELQADCFAGIWGKFTDQKGMLERGDLDEALNAAAQIGDDALQKRSQGYVVPDSFTHGTSAQRAKWFKRGYESGKMTACDTFSGNI